MTKKRDLSWLGSLSLSTGKYPSLTAMKFLMEKLGHPEQQTRFVHVAGTNGKGSVVEMMAKILEKAGYKTGKFMSPHLVRFSERIQVDGHEITDAKIEQLLDELQPVLDEYEAEFGVEITLFEIETTMALVYFAQQECDIVVLEVGLGGEFDCTNIVTPDVSVIVSVGYDHMNVLGESLTEIATQKAGIIKPAGKVVSGELPEEARKIVRQKCEEVRAEWREAKAGRAKIVPGGVRLVDEDFGEINIPLKGEKQVENAAVCLECIRLLRGKGWKISDQAVKEGLGEVEHKGRFEVVYDSSRVEAGSVDEEDQKDDANNNDVDKTDDTGGVGSVTVVFDGAHNLPAVENFWKNVEAYYPETKKTFVVSLLKKKDSRRILEALLKRGEKYIFTTGNDAELYTPAAELLEMAEAIDLEGDYRAMDLIEALEEVKRGGQAKERAKKQNEVVFVVGTFYIYGEVERIFGGSKKGGEQK